MDKWEALKNFLENIVGRGQQVYAGHILMVMDELDKNPNWSILDGWSDDKTGGATNAR